MPLTQKRNKQAQVLKALAHPLRILVVEHLLNGEKCVNDIKDLFDVSQPNVSQHLNILKYSEIVDFHQRGNLRCYFLKDPKNIKNLIRVTQEMIK
ncbi:MAG: winged helix-turn-helix transcriptional regulator [Candidatus Aminicenantes bacterium]|nr:winged helix-turn-helix transcriptional regulator [Candidatus Aminicenantes bacterium]